MDRKPFHIWVVVKLKIGKVRDNPVGALSKWCKRIEMRLGNPNDPVRVRVRDVHGSGLDA